jgi:hypothetical protein
MLILQTKGHALVNCYALGPTGRYYVFHFSYTDRVQHNSARIGSFSKLSIFRKSAFVFLSGFTVFAFVFKCRSRNSRGVFQPFSSLPVMTVNFEI